MFIVYYRYIAVISVQNKAVKNVSPAPGGRDAIAAIRSAVCGGAARRMAVFYSSECFCRNASKGRPSASPTSAGWKPPV